MRFGFPEKNPDIDIPEGVEHLFDWFWDLNDARKRDMGDPQPITPSDIVDWCSVTGEIVTREEVALLRRMDAAFRAAVSEEQAAQQSKEEARNGR